MFENLVAQPVTALLVDDINAARLPPSMLFSGQRASGKLTAALELARILSCSDGRASWTCACPSCLRHKELVHPDLLVLGPRDCILEIRAAAAAFLRNRGTASRFLFIRSVRKLVIRFNPALQDQDDARFSKATPLLSEIDERLEEIDPSRPLPDDDSLGKIVSSIVDAAEKLEGDHLYDSIPVNFVRGTSAWTRLSPSGKKKTVIVENADCMQDAARNAFLKILEEPPEDVVFILTTSRRGAIMPTILSRVRTYAFVDRGEAEQHEVINRVFHDAPKVGELLGGYFNRFLPVQPEEIADRARMFINGVLEEAMDEGRKPLPSMRSALGQGLESASVAEIGSALNKFKPGVVYRLFLTRCARFMRASLRSCAPDAREVAVYSRWTASIQEANDAVAIYNLSPASALERLRQSMKDSL